MWMMVMELRSQLTYFDIYSNHSHCPTIHLCWHFLPFEQELALVRLPELIDLLQKQQLSSAHVPHRMRKFLSRDEMLSAICEHFLLVSNFLSLEFSVKILP